MHGNNRCIFSLSLCCIRGAGFADPAEHISAAKAALSALVTAALEVFKGSMDLWELTSMRSRRSLERAATALAADGLTKFTTNQV